MSQMKIKRGSNLLNFFLNFCVVLLVSISFVSSVLAKEKVTIADFNTIKSETNLGTKFGTWDRDTTDPSQSCKIDFLDQGEAGRALEISYDVDSPNPAYNGVWFQLKGLDVSKYENFSFRVKGDTKTVKIELKNLNETGYYFVTEVADEWQQIVIPLADFKHIDNFTELTELLFIFDDLNATKKEGKLYVDDIGFADLALKKRVYKAKVLAKVNLSGVNLSGTDLSGVILNRVNLYRTILKGVNLRRAKLIGTDLIGADLNQANLEGANLSESNLYRANLENSNLHNANLTRTDLRFANLKGVNFKGADLSQADLSFANMSGADFTDCELEKVKVEKSNFFEATGLSETQNLYLQANKALNVPE